jgi:hypothetical protein
MKRFSFIILLAVTVMFCAAQLNASWVWNALHGPGEKTGDGLIVDGASAFLLSYSDVLLLLNESEMGPEGIAHPDRSLPLAESALSRLQASLEKYRDALGLLKITIYKPTMLKQLKHFDYNKMTEERRLDPGVMSRVSAHLAAGNLKGLFEESLLELKQLVDQLQDVRDRLSKGEHLDIEVLRRLYDGYSRFMQTGYYSSLVLQTMGDR